MSFFLNNTIQVDHIESEYTTLGVIIDKNSFKDICKMSFFDLQYDQLKINDKTKDNNKFRNFAKDYKQFINNLQKHCETNGYHINEPKPNICNDIHNNNSQKEKTSDEVVEIFNIFFKANKSNNYYDISKVYSVKGDIMARGNNNEVYNLTANNGRIMNNELYLKPKDPNSDTAIKITNLFINYQKPKYLYQHEYIIKTLDDIIKTQHKIGNDYILYLDHENKQMHKVSFEKFIDIIENDIKQIPERYSDDKTLKDDLLKILNNCKTLVKEITNNNQIVKQKNEKEKQKNEERIKMDYKTIKLSGNVPMRFTKVNFKKIKEIIEQANKNKNTKKTQNKKVKKNTKNLNKSYKKGL